MATTTDPRTAIQLCKAILSVMGWLPKQTAERIASNHSRTWSLVCLHDAGLCSPKPAVLPDLARLWETVDRAREEQLGLTATRLDQSERQMRADLEALQG